MFYLNKNYSGGTVCFFIKDHGYSNGCVGIITYQEKCLVRDLTSYNYN